MSEMSNMDDEVDSELLDTIRQYQNSIIKHSELGNDAKILSYIAKLYDMPITVAHLQDTGIGRTVNSLRKYNGDVGSASRAVVNKWKTMVAKEEDEENTSNQPTEEDSSPSSTASSLDKHESRSDSRSEERHRSKDKHERRSDSSDKHSRKHESSDRSSRSKQEDSSNKHKSHSRHDEKKDSHKSSHSRDKEHKSSSGETERKHRKEEKSRHDKKRKHAEEEPSSVKKKRYESDEYEDDDDDDVSPNRCNGSGLQIDEYPDSTVSDEHEKDFANQSEDYRENTQSPVAVEESKSSSKHKKHHKSDKQHRSHDKDSEKKINGHSSSSSSSKKSSHRDKETKRVEEKSRSEKSSPSKKSDSKDTKSKHSSSSSSTRSSEKMLSPSKVKKEILMQDDNGIDSGSGASFAEALGMIIPTKGSSSKTTYKKKTVYSAPASPTPSTSTMKPSRTAKSNTLSPLIQSPNLLSPNLKLEPLVLIPPQLPEITTNYKPLGNSCTYDVSSPIHNLRNMSEEEALSVVISSKTQRTKVYSGNKTNWGYVPTLFNLCVRSLQDNIDSLEFTGGVPYEILKPVLERATANQLLNAEYYNPYLIEESDELWELHCKKECKGQKRQEMETWREMYLRCRDERDAKLKALTVNIKQSIDKSLPVRQTKLAYVDSVVKPPRGVARKQAKYGTDRKPTITPSSRLSALAAGGPDKISVPNPGARAASSSSAAMMKPKKAPLMQKTLALMKGRFGRR
ncbi:Elongin A [Carabus blaptoides fortunei]